MRRQMETLVLLLAGSSACQGSCLKWHEQVLNGMSKFPCVPRVDRTAASGVFGFVLFSSVSSSVCCCGIMVESRVAQGPVNQVSVQITGLPPPFL